ncbi:MAG: hypothetical protein AB7F94_03735 [Nitrospira sp.]
MRLYDYPHPRRPGQTIRGYDRPHAVRTAKMCVAVADRLGHPRDRIRRYHIACLGHDLGRAACAWTARHAGVDIETTVRHAARVD